MLGGASFRPGGHGCAQADLPGGQRRTDLGGLPVLRRARLAAGRGQAPGSGGRAPVDAFARRGGGEAEEIAESAQVGLNRDPAGLRAELDALNQARRRNTQLDKPQLQAALAEAYGELGSLQKAVRYYERAIVAKQAAVSLKAIEQHANLKARLAARRAPPTAAKEQRGQSLRAIGEALDALDKLIALAGPTVERLNLKGSAYKRLAVVEHAAGRKAALENMRMWYGKAHELGAEEGDPGYYSQLMVITAEILEQHAEGASADAARRSRLRRIVSSQRKGPDFGRLLGRRRGRRRAPTGGDRRRRDERQGRGRDRQGLPGALAPRWLAAEAEFSYRAAGIPGGHAAGGSRGDGECTPGADRILGSDPRPDRKAALTTPAAARHLADLHYSQKRVYTRFMSSQCYCALLRGAARKVTAMYDDALTPVGVTLAQFRLLRLIERAPGPLSLTELGRVAELDRSTMGRNVRLLQRKDLVRIAPGGDQREATVSLEEAGRQALRDATPLWSDAQRRIETVLGTDTARQLQILLQSL